jgi:hypothetical protein
MARERWFVAEEGRRRGPLSLDQLVESVFGQPEPRTVLVWRKGFAGWTRAEDVPDVERRLALAFAKGKAEAARRAPVVARAEPRPPRMRVEAAKPGSPVLVYGGIAAGAALLGLLGWLFWPRAEPAAPREVVPLGGTTPENAPAVVIPAGPRAAPPAATVPRRPAPTTTTTTRPAPAPAPPATVRDSEGVLPPEDLRRLRPVWGWEGETLRATVYNGTAWRVTEIHARVSRFVHDDFVEDRRPILLVPPEGEMDPRVADILSKVAPDRKRAGLNALDTGVFEGKAGARPENFRAEIESARGYPPRR